MPGLRIIAAIIFDIIIALEFGSIAREKGYDSTKYFWYCLLFPFAGYLMVVALPQKTGGEDGQRREEIPARPADKEALTTWTCVHCGTRNPFGQTRCTHCKKG